MIVGQVLDGDSNQPVAGALVSLTGYLTGDGGLRARVPTGSESLFADATSQQVLTSSDGYFVFSRLAAGRYAVAAEAFGYLPPDYRPRVLDVRDDESPMVVRLRLRKYASISGRVVDEVGEPVVGAPVAVLRRMGGGRSPALRRQAPAVRTDDRGAYRISELLPGRYFVAVLASATSVPADVARDLDVSDGGPLPGSPTWSGLAAGGSLAVSTGEGTRVGDVVLQRDGPPAVLDASGGMLSYATTFHPGSSTALSATEIELESGESRANVDIALTYNRSFRVSGAIAGPDGPVASLMVRLLPPDSGAVLVSDVVPVLNAVTGADGAFAFLGVPPGQYVLGAVYFSARDTEGAVSGSGEGLWALQSVTVDDGDVSDLLVAMARGFRVGGRVIFEGAGGWPLSGDRFVTISLRPFGSGDARLRSWPTRVSPDGTFMSSPAFPPGRYAVRVSIHCVSIGACPTNWRLKSIARGTSPAPYDVIGLDGSDVPDLIITLTEASSGVVGTVVDESGASDDDADVLVFPSDTTLWKEDMYSRRVRRVHATLAGTFEISDLAPGEYYVVAVEAGFPDEDPRALEALVAGANSVTVTEGTMMSIQLRTVGVSTR